MLMRLALRAFGLAWLALACTVALAQEYRYSVLVDGDLSEASGCQVVLDGGQIVAGIERRLSAHVPVAGPQVAALTVETCNGGSFGSAQTIAGGYPVGFDLGAGGGDVVELGGSLEQVTGYPYARAVRLHFTAESATGSDLLSSRDGGSGGPIILGAPATPIPALGALGLLVLAAGVLLISGMRRHRRLLRRAMFGLLAASGAALAANFVLDGLVGVDQDRECL